MNLNEAIKKAKPNMDKIKDVDKHLESIRFSVIDKQKVLFDFFMWFRENGENHLGKSVEELIEYYLKKHHAEKTEKKSGH